VASLDAAGTTVVFDIVVIREEATEGAVILTCGNRAGHRARVEDSAPKGYFNHRLPEATPAHLRGGVGRKLLYWRPRRRVGPEELAAFVEEGHSGGTMTAGPTSPDSDAHALGPAHHPDGIEDRDGGLVPAQVLHGMAWGFRVDRGERITARRGCGRVPPRAGR
jgi:hypothetical protein